MDNKSHISEPGKILKERYKIENNLGRGGFGITFLAVDLQRPKNPRCVVKKLSPARQDSGTLLCARQRFETEAKVLEQLGTHDQIPQLLAYFEEDGEFYLVQEFVDGNNLRREITPGEKQSEDEVFALLRDILQVLAFVHQSNVIHRDINPSNVIRRGSDNKLTLIDFGAVKEINNLEVNAEGQLNITRDIGTPGYKPSEQENGDPKLSSDIYAVGILGIQALTGLRVHELEKDSSGEIVWRKSAPNVSNALACILDKMVRKDYRQRYESATETLDALNKANEATLAVKHGNAPLPLTSPERPQNRVQNFSIRLAGYPLIAVSLLLLAIPGISIFQIFQRQFLEAKNRPFEVKIDLNDVCQQDFIYQDIYEKNPSQKRTNIGKKGPKYKEDSSVWPVFRWVCIYDPNRSDRVYENEEIGMDLDTYCEKKYPNDKTKPSHHDYMNPDSLHCTRPKP